jgi:type II secretory pathway component PulK
MLLRTTTNGTRTSAGRRGGFVLIAVLMVVTVLSLAAYQYSALMDAETLAAERIRKTAECKALADSGVHFLAAHVADPEAYEGVLNGNPFDNPGSFQSVAVSEGQSARSQGRFSLVTLDYSEPPTAGSLPLRYGVTDETGKLNLNALYALDTSGRVLHDALMKLENMTDEIAWSIVDWIDPDDEPNAGGAETQYYGTRTPPYQCKSAPLDSIEELLLVKGVTPSLLFGTDRNRNGRLDPGEDDGTGYTTGWAAYLTVYSRERNVDKDGNPRINLNGNDLATLNTDLTNAIGMNLATFVIGYRLYGSGSGGGGGGGGGGGKGANVQLVIAGDIGMLQKQISQAFSSASSTPPKARQRVSSKFALVNATVSFQMQIAGENGQMQTVTVMVPSPLADKSQQTQMLAELLDKTTTQQGNELPARVNINTAPREVLLALPGMTEVTVDSVMAKRPSFANGDSPDPNFATIAWLLQDQTMTTQQLQSLERFITARTQVYRVQSIGYFDEGGPMARVEAVIDANQGKPRIVYYRDLTDLGRSINPRTLNR